MVRCTVRLVGIITYTCTYCLRVTSSLIKLHLWSRMNTHQKWPLRVLWWTYLTRVLGNTHTHTLSLLGGRNTTSASVWVNPYVREASGAHGTKARESLLIGNRLADRQSCCIMAADKKKKEREKKEAGAGSPPPPPRPARGQMAVEESERAAVAPSPVLLLGRCIVYLLENKSYSRARPAQTPLFDLTGRCFQSHLLGRS